MCIIVLNFVAIGGTIAKIWRFTYIISTYRHLEPVMCIFGPPTNFIIMQNPVGMNAVVLIIRKLQYFAS